MRKTFYSFSSFSVESGRAVSAKYWQLIRNRSTLLPSSACLNRDRSLSMVSALTMHIGPGRSIKHASHGDTARYDQTSFVISATLSKDTSLSITR